MFDQNNPQKIARIVIKRFYISDFCTKLLYFLNPQNRHHHVRPVAQQKSKILSCGCQSWAKIIYRIWLLFINTLYEEIELYLILDHY